MYALFLEPARAHSVMETAEAHTHVWLKVHTTSRAHGEALQFMFLEQILNCHRTGWKKGSAGVPMPCLYQGVRIVSFTPSLLIANHWK